MKKCLLSLVVLTATLLLTCLLGCVHSDFNTDFRNRLLTQAQEDMSCPDLKASKVVGPDKPTPERIAVWSVHGCGKTQKYSAACMTDYAVNCNFYLGDSSSFGQ